jgi:hypothetical protein
MADSGLVPSLARSVPRCGFAALLGRVLTDPEVKGTLSP